MIEEVENGEARKKKKNAKKMPKKKKQEEAEGLEARKVPEGCLLFFHGG